MNRPTSYSILSYGEMVTDKPRMHAYVQALEKVVRPGCVVLDIGAGTGIFSLLACQLGAGKIHLVEPDDSIHVARAISAANDYTNRITFHQTLSTQIRLTKQADVIISDLRGVLPLLQHHIPSIVDARDRLLAPGGKLIPDSDKIWAALVESPDVYRSYEEPWLRNTYGLNMHAGHKFVTNTWRKVSLNDEELLVPPQCWATIDYNTVTNTDVSNTLRWTVERSGICHGLAVWFDTTLAEDIGFSNTPGKPELIYGQAFFPWEKPVKLNSGDIVSVDLRANLIDGDYTWRWKTKVHSGGSSPSLKTSFNQSTFFAKPFSLEKLQQQEAGYIPSLKIEGKADRFLLSLMDGSTKLETIARQAAEQFPNLFKDWKTALKRAGELARKYST